MNEGEQGVIKVLSLKADKNDVEKLHEIKTDKDDTDLLLELIMETSRQV